MCYLNLTEDENIATIHIAVRNGEHRFWDQGKVEEKLDVMYSLKTSADTKLTNARIQTIGALELKGRQLERDRVDNQDSNRRFGDNLWTLIVAVLACFLAVLLANQCSGK